MLLPPLTILYINRYPDQPMRKEILFQEIGQPKQYNIRCRNTRVFRMLRTLNFSPSPLNSISGRTVSWQKGTAKVARRALTQSNHTQRRRRGTSRIDKTHCVPWDLVLSNGGVRTGRCWSMFIGRSKAHPLWQAAAWRPFNRAGRKVCRKLSSRASVRHMYKTTCGQNWQKSSVSDSRVLYFTFIGKNPKSRLVEPGEMLSHTVGFIPDRLSQVMSSVTILVSR